MNARTLTIISGGQTGVDRAALDAALEYGIRIDGWCPRGRWAEDGPIPHRYPLRETESDDPAERTAANVRDSGATLILASDALGGGTALTQRLAKEMKRPLLIVDPAEQDTIQKIRHWLEEESATTINIAGPRESESPGIYDRAKATLQGLFRDLLRGGGRSDS